MEDRKHTRTDYRKNCHRFCSAIHTYTPLLSEEKKNGEPAVEKKPAAQLEEDDEFEDFPIEGMGCISWQA